MLRKSMRTSASTGENLSGDNRISRLRCCGDASGPIPACTPANPPECLRSLSFCSRPRVGDHANWRRQSRETRLARNCQGTKDGQQIRHSGPPTRTVDHQSSSGFRPSLQLPFARSTPICQPVDPAKSLRIRWRQYLSRQIHVAFFRYCNKNCMGNVASIRPTKDSDRLRCNRMSIL